MCNDYHYKYLHTWFGWCLLLLGFGGVGPRKSGFGVSGATTPSRTPSMGQSVPKVEEVDDSEAEGDGDGDEGGDSDVE